MMMNSLSVLMIVAAGVAAGVTLPAFGAEGAAESASPRPAQDATQGSAAADDGPAQSRSPNGPAGFVSESTLPAGFPDPGPAGEAVIKAYPPARAAWTPTGQFMRLFFHISREDVPMTTPVMMSRDGEGDADQQGGTRPAPGGLEMAFFYPSTQTGSAGPDGVDPSVEVIEVPAQRVVSYGLFGNPTQARLTQAREAVDARIEQDGLTATGDWRLMGYNSPAVPPARRFHEVQRPIATPAPATEPGGRAGDDQPTPPEPAAG
jgi:hypothetical protein